MGPKATPTQSGLAISRELSICKPENATDSPLSFYGMLWLIANDIIIGRAVAKLALQRAPLLQASLHRYLSVSTFAWNSYARLILLNRYT